MKVDGAGVDPMSGLRFGHEKAGSGQRLAVLQG
jgi:hypothetical protein